MKTEKNKLLLAVIVFIAIVLVDQLTKSYFLQNYPEIVEFNTGLALSLGGNNNLLNGLIAIAGLFLILYLLKDYLRVNSKTGEFIFLVLIAVSAGGFSNLIDRLIRSGVTDFIHIPGITTFNVADAIITTGIIVVLITELIISGRKKTTNNNRRTTGSEA